MLAAAEGASLLVSTWAGRLASICVMVALRAAHKGSRRWLISAVMAASCSSICSSGCKSLRVLALAVPVASGTVFLS